jgi:hypothetical protein
MPIEDRSHPVHLRYRLSSKVLGADSGVALDRFAMFGNFLAWHLHASGAFGAEEANRLLTLWKGKRVG